MADIDDRLNKLFQEGTDDIDEPAERSCEPEVEENLAEPQPSLQELLTDQEADRSSDVAARNEDESGSGMFRLASMVARSTVPADRASEVPPPASIAPPPMSVAPPPVSVAPPPPTMAVPPPHSVTPPPHSVTPSPASDSAVQPSTIPPTIAGFDPSTTGAESGVFETTTTDMPSTPPLPYKRRSVAPFIVLGVIVVVASAIAAVFIVTNRNAESGEDKELAELAVQLNEIKRSEERQQNSQESQLRAELAEAQAALVKTVAEDQQVASPGAESITISEEEGTDHSDVVADNEEADEVDEADEPETAEIAKSTKKKKRRRWAHKRNKRRRSRRRGKAKKKPAVSAPAAQSGDELDSLLGGGGRKKSGGQAQVATGGGGKLSRADVRSGMAPMAAKAQSCGGQTPGTVQLRVTVGGNGRVQAVHAMGSFGGTNTGRCVENIVRNARFPSFEGSSFKFTYPIRLR